MQAKSLFWCLKKANRAGTLIKTLGYTRAERFVHKSKVTWSANLGALTLQVIWILGSKPSRQVDVAIMNPEMMKLAMEQMVSPKHIFCLS